MGGNQKPYIGIYKGAGSLPNVVSNALILKANFPEKEISVNSSCCAGVTPETHEAALRTMQMCQINIAT